MSIEAPIRAESDLDLNIDLLRHDPSLIAGCQYLIKNASHVQVDLYLARHQSADDLGAAGSFESVIREGGYDAIGIEANGWRLEDQQLINDYSNGRASINKLMDRVDGFGLRTLLAVGGKRTPVVLCDVQSGTESDFGAIMRRKRQAITSPSNGGNMDEALAQFAQYQNIREWCVVGRLGSQLQERVGEQDKTKALLAFGAGHNGLATKLQYLGVDADVIFQGEATPVSKEISSKIAEISLNQAVLLDIAQPNID